MKYEDIDNEQVKAFVQAYYVYQSALNTTPVGQVGVNNQPSYPRYFKKYNNELERIEKELIKAKIEVKKALLPEEPDLFSDTGFLQYLERQKALKFVLVLNGKVILPPAELYLMVRSFIERLGTPWN